jgi:hypothetical protein
MSAASVTLKHVHKRSNPVLRLHGEALLTAKRPELQPLIDHLREVAQGRDDIRVECAGTSPVAGLLALLDAARNSLRPDC